MTACLGKTHIWYILSLSGILKTLLHCLLVLNVVKKCRTNLIFCLFVSEEELSFFIWIPEELFLFLYFLLEVCISHLGPLSICS